MKCNSAPSSFQLEALEKRALLAVDAAGWTTLARAADAKIIYVSSHGSDSNNGLSSTAPVKTIAKAASLVRSGYPDWMLLKAGDTFNECVSGWKKSGRSASAPMVVGRYGSGARPLVKSGAANGFTLASGVHDLVIGGIRFTANKRDPKGGSYVGAGGGMYGFQALGGDNNILIEDCQFDHYVQNVVFTAYGGSCSNCTVRRSVIVDAYSKSGSSDGVYASGSNNLLLEGNVIDHNGWNEYVGGAVATMFNHNIYITSNNNGLTVRGNIIANASSHGLQARSGGNIEDNLFLYNPIHVSYGLVSGSSVKASGVSGHITGNVFLGSRTINGSPRGTAIEISNTSKSSWTFIAGNIFAHDNIKNSAAIQLAVGSNVTNSWQAVGINHLIIENNITYHWKKGFSTYASLVDGKSGANGVNGLYVRNNDFQMSWSQYGVQHWHAYKSPYEYWAGNSYNNYNSASGWFWLSGRATSFISWKSVVDHWAVAGTPKYVDPLRSIESYAAKLGVASSSTAFLAQARQQSKANWRTAFSAGAAISYIQGGFAETTRLAAGANLPAALAEW